MSRPKITDPTRPGGAPIRRARAGLRPVRILARIFRGIRPDLGLAWLASALACATALANPTAFNLPAQPADKALLAFSGQSQVQILFQSSDLRSAVSNEVSGTMEPVAALERLLVGTGFWARQTGPGRFVVVRLKPPPGSIRGRLLAPDGTGAATVRVLVESIRQGTLTDADGRFTLPNVPPGTYTVLASGPGFAPVRITDIRVATAHATELDPLALTAASDLNRLEPFVVKGTTLRNQSPNGNPDEPVPERAAGNIDLSRTADDALPFEVYDRNLIVRSGAIDLNGFLQRELLDADASTTPPEQAPGGTPGLGSTATNAIPIPGGQQIGGSSIAGSNNLDLRGFGVGETVILVDGRRMPQSVAAGTQTQPPDVNLIPLSLVDRIEVLPMSASALYSGNPVGGVINIILRPEFNTTELTTTYSNGLGRADAPQSQVSLMSGQTLLGGKLRVRLNATLIQSTPPTESELGYVRQNLADHPSLATAPYYRATPNILSTSGAPLFGAGTPDFTSVAPGADGNGGIAAFAGRQGIANEDLFKSFGKFASSYNSIDYPYGQSQRATVVYGSATYDLLPRVQIGIDGNYSRTIIHQGYDLFEGNLLVGASNPVNPFGQDVQVTLNETAPALGENYDETHLDFASVVLGALIRLPADIRVDLDAQYSHNVTKYRGVEGVDPVRWQQLVDTGAYNPFRDTQRFGPPGAFYDQALVYYGSRGNFVTLGNYDTFDSAVRITDPSIPLPTGPAILNLGADFERDSLDNYTDVLRYGDGSLYADEGEWAGRTLEQASFFGEAQAPLIPERWLPRWLKKVSTDFAGRYIAASSAQNTSFDPTGAIKVDFACGLSLRATIATANRFPSAFLSHWIPAALPQSGGTGPVVPFTVFDPLRGGSPESVSASDELNPTLRPEADVTRSAGAVFQAGKLHHLRLSVDFVDTKTSGELVYLDAQAVVDFEAQLPGRVTRSAPIPGDGYTVGPITSVLTGSYNLAWKHTQNWNASADTTWKDCLGGTLDLYARAVAFTEFEVVAFPGNPVVDELRNPDDTVPGILRYRANFGAGWSTPDLGFGLDGHYFHSRVIQEADRALQGSDRISPYWQFDAFVQANLLKWLHERPKRFGLRGQLRINNLFGAQPPEYAADPYLTGRVSYGDWRGRVLSCSLTATY